jgi:hypothetical protein
MRLLEIEIMASHDYETSVTVHSIRNIGDGISVTATELIRCAAVPWVCLHRRTPSLAKTKTWQGLSLSFRFLPHQEGGDRAADFAILCNFCGAERAQGFYHPLGGGGRKNLGLALAKS